MANSSCKKLELLPDGLKFHFALVDLGITEFMPQLAEVLTAHFTNQAEVYLFEVGNHQDTIEWLYPYLNSTDPKIRSGMARVLDRIGNYAVC